MVNSWCNIKALIYGIDDVDAVLPGQQSDLHHPVCPSAVCLRKYQDIKVQRLSEHNLSVAADGSGSGFNIRPHFLQESVSARQTQSSAGTHLFLRCDRCFWEETSFQFPVEWEACCLTYQSNEPDYCFHQKTECRLCFVKINAHGHISTDQRLKKNCAFVLKISFLYGTTFQFYVKESFSKP